MHPIQCRMNGININETSKYQSKAPDKPTHALRVEDPYGEEGGMINIPLQLSVVTSYFPVRKPTKAELDDDSITKNELTAEDLVWDPIGS